MKITKLFLIAISALLFSCGSDDEAPLPTAEGMIGTWDVTDIDYSGTTTTSYMGQSIKARFTGHGKEIDYTTTFSSSPNTVVSEGSYLIELTTTIGGESETETYEFDEALMDGTWELDGRKVIITNDGQEQEGTITKQSETELEVRVDLEQSMTDSGITVKTKVKAVYKFEKSIP